MTDKDESDLCDNWEDLEDSEKLDKQLEKINLNRDREKNGSTSIRPEALILSPEDIRLKCMPPEPLVKILQRPNQNGIRNNFVSNDGKPKQPVKSLQQREQEYAEARLRILGEARSPEEEHFISVPDDRIQRIQSKTEILRPSENCAGIIRLPKGPDGTTGFNFPR